jgi:hypothetical protein
VSQGMQSGRAGSPGMNPGPTLSEVEVAIEELAWDDDPVMVKSMRFRAGFGADLRCTWR